MDVELPSEGGAAEACPSNQGHGLLGDASELQPSPLPSAVERKSDEVTRSSDQPQNPFKKRKVAVFLAYVGHGYSGMQHNLGFKTIEGELLEAFHKAGAILDSNVQFDKIQWKRAARTDKGVSATFNVVSAKLIIEPPGLVERINAQLPEQIRILGIKRTTGSFDARILCDRRCYEYILPIWAFDPECCMGRHHHFKTMQAVKEAAEAAEAQDDDGPAEAEGNEEADDHGGGKEARMDDGDAGGEIDMANHEGGDCGPAPGAGLEDCVPAPEAQDVAVGAPDKLECSEVTKEDNAVRGGDEAADAVDQVGGGGGAPAADGTDDGGGEESKMSEAEGAGGDEGMEGAPTEAVGGLGKPEIGPSESTFVFGPEQKDRLNALLGKFVGTHNFHNFTTGVSPTEARSRRHILSMDCKPILAEGQPYVLINVVGASFMIHQIRKMVGMAVAVMRGVADEECIDLALAAGRDCNIPMAPALGLYLVQSIFNSYNERWAGEEGREPLLAEEFWDQMEAFKQNHIYPHMAAQEKAEGITANWLRSLNNLNYSFSKWKDRPNAVSKKTLPPTTGEGDSGHEVGGKRSLEDTHRPRGRGRGGEGRRGRGRGGEGRRGGRRGGRFKRQKHN